MDNIPAPSTDSFMENYIQEWLENTEELNQIHVRDYPEATIARLIQLRGLYEMTWNDIALQLGIRSTTLRSFYNRQCMPRLRRLRQELGDL